MAGCARPTRIAVTAEDRLTALQQGPPVAADQVWSLERSGPSPGDTSVAFLRREGRRVVLRHGPPDNAVFLVLDIPADTAAATGDSIRISARPLPAIFGVALEGWERLPPGATGTFSYAMHFMLPVDAMATYPTPTRFDRQLGAVRKVGDDRVQFLVDERPASDVIRFPLTTPGTYLLAAPK